MAKYQKSDVPLGQRVINCLKDFRNQLQTNDKYCWRDTMKRHHMGTFNKQYLVGIKNMSDSQIEDIANKICGFYQMRGDRGGKGRVEWKKRYAGQPQDLQPETPQQTDNSIGMCVDAMIKFMKANNIENITFKGLTVYLDTE